MQETSGLGEPEAAGEIRQQTRALGFDAASDPKVGALLRTLATAKPAGAFLELGTGTGMATAWLAHGMDARATLVTVDNDPRTQAVAKRALGHDARITFIETDGAAYLETLAPACFDLIFADAWPGKYSHLHLALHALKPGGLYVIDDMLPQANWPDGHAANVATLLETLSAHKDLHVTRLDWASGVVLAVKRDA